MGNKGWSILFGVVLLGCALGYIICPLVGWGMPTGISSHAGHVDDLYDFILIVTGFFFFLTEGLFVFFLWRYASASGKRLVRQDAAFPTSFNPITNILHDQHRVEMAWTLVPALILIVIAFAQVNTWADIKYQSRKDAYEKDKPALLQVRISARQFEWRMAYPSSKRYKKWLADKNAAETKLDIESFATTPQFDDLKNIVNELHIYQDHQVVVHLTTRDVIHSFNLPNFRVKQDTLPGKMIPVWFKTIDSKVHKSFNTKKIVADNKPPRYVDGINPETGVHDANFIYDIPCAELCGWGHYRMIGRVFVHKDQEEFLDWLELAEKNYFSVSNR